MTAQNNIETRLAELLKTIQDSEQWQVGYPGNQSFDYSPLIPFLSHCLNNLGDPFHQTNFRANTHQFEREVILHFAQLHGPGGRLGLRHLRWHRRQHVRPLPWPGNSIPQVCSTSPRKPTTPSLKIGPRPEHAPTPPIKRQHDGEIDYDDLRDMLTVHP